MEKEMLSAGFLYHRGGSYSANDIGNILYQLIVVSYELHDRVKLAAEESSKNKIECMEEIYIGDML